MNRTRTTLAIALVTAACHAKAGNGEAPVTLDRTLEGPFAALTVTHAIRTEWTVGESDRITLEGESNLLPFITNFLWTGVYQQARPDGSTETRSLDYLELDVGPHDMLLSPTVPITVGFSAPVLHWVVADGGSGLHARGPVVQDAMDLTTEGGSHIELEEVRLGTLVARVANAAKVTVGGRATRLELHANGEGSFDGSGFAADTLFVRLDAGSSAELRVHDEIAGTVGPGSKLVVHGIPTTRDVTTFGDGVVEFRR